MSDEGGVYLIVTDSVHVTAAACDYLEGRLEDDDEVRALASDDRDGQEALNVVRVRLPGVTVTTDTRPTADLADRALSSDADVIVVGRSVGEGTPGDVAERLFTGAERPLVVVSGSENPETI
ncbi:MAG: universal stress protein [Natronomonas sp.]